MPTLHVCPLSRLQQTAALLSASHLVTIVSPGTPVERPHAITAERHLDLTVSDITAAQAGHVLVGAAHVERLIAFARGWDRSHPLLIHCYAGVSRSTAAAYVCACALAPDRAEAELARRLRDASPSATPNAAIVAAGDAALAREGRMIAAIGAIGRGTHAFEGEPFQLAFD